jgi:phage/plasmid-like protein (TIGR03299 family)
MSKETLEFLRTNVRVGYTTKDGPAWWAADKSNAGYLADGSHFEGPVPEDVVRRVLDVPFVAAKVLTEYVNAAGETVTTVDPDRQAIVSPDDGHRHGYFSNGWKLHGYQEWTADQLAAILDQTRGELGVKSVGLLQTRGVAFIQAQLEGSGMEVGGFPFTPYLLAATSVNGHLSSTYATGVIAAVCDNTLAASLSGALAKFRVKHSRNSHAKLSEVRDALGLVYQAADDFIESAAALQAIDVSDKDFAAWLDEVTPVPAADPKSSTGGAKYTNAVKERDALLSLWQHDPKVTPWAGTAFGVLQAGNTYRTWQRGVKGADGGRMERNLLNMVTGKGVAEDASDLDKLASVLARKLVMA